MPRFGVAISWIVQALVVVALGVSTWVMAFGGTMPIVGWRLEGDPSGLFRALGWLIVAVPLFNWVGRVVSFSIARACQPLVEMRPARTSDDRPEPDVAPVQADGFDYESVGPSAETVTSLAILRAGAERMQTSPAGALRWLRDRGLADVDGFTISVEAEAATAAIEGTSSPVDSSPPVTSVDRLGETAVIKFMGFDGASPPVLGTLFRILPDGELEELADACGEVQVSVSDRLCLIPHQPSYWNDPFRGVDGDLLDEIFAPPAIMPRLRDEDLWALRHFEGLEGLNVGFTTANGFRDGTGGSHRVTDAGVMEIVTSFTELRELSLHSRHLTDTGLILISTMPSLRALRLGGAPITSAGLHHLEGSNLESLAVEFVRRPLGSDLDFLSGMSTLTSLGLRGCGVTLDGTAEILAGLPRLTALDLGHNRPPRFSRDPIQPGWVGDEAAAVIGELADLETLMVDGCRLSDDGLAELTSLGRLRRLSLAQTRVSAEAGACLAQLRGLEDLDVSNTSFDDRGLESITNLDRLQTLRLAHCRLTDRSLDSLLALGNLRELDLTSTGIGVDGLARLGELPRLQQLTVWHLDDRPEEAERLQAAMPHVRIDWSVG